MALLDIASSPPYTRPQSLIDNQAVALDLKHAGFYAREFESDLLGLARRRGPGPTIGRLDKLTKTIQGRLNAEGLRVAIVASRWNDFVVSRMIGGAVDALERLGASSDAITIIRVPGSFELPMATKRAAASGGYDALVCLGVIIRGETSHNEYIASEVFKGVAQVSFETNLPIALGVVTADNLEQAIDRAGAKSGNKGFEAAMTAVELANLYREF